MQITGTSTIAADVTSSGTQAYTGAVTLGVMQQIVRAFGRVESSFQYLVNSWTTIVELISVYKRLRAFERQIRAHGSQPRPPVAVGAE